MSYGNDSVEWSEEILALVDELQEKAEEGGVSRNERVVLDVVETVGLLADGGEGLQEFWQSELPHRRIIQAFDVIGCSAMVDVLNASQWCQSDRAFSEAETDYLDEIEENLEIALSEVADLLEEFVEDELGV